MLLYKVGDRVRVRSDLQNGKSYGVFGVTDKMAAFRGEIVTIKGTEGCGYYIDGFGQPWFTDQMLENISTERGENMSINQTALANLKEYLMTYQEKTLVKIHKELRGLLNIDSMLVTSGASYVADKICRIIASRIERDGGYSSVATAIRMSFDRHNLKREYAENFIGEVAQLTVREREYAQPTKTNYNEKGENTMNTNKIFNQFMPEVAKGGTFALTMSGKLAVRRGDGDFVVYNATTGTIENQLDLVFGADQLSGMVYLMPTAADKLKKNDIVKFSDSIYGVVITDSEDGKVRFINLNSGGAGDRIKETNVLTGAKLYKKVVSMLDLTGANGGAAINPAMFMLMGNKGGTGNNDMLTMMALSGGLGGATTGGFNPAMLMLMDNKGGNGSNDMFKMLAMTSLMGGGANANPFANLFGGAATAATTATAE